MILNLSPDAFYCDKSRILHGKLYSDFFFFYDITGSLNHSKGQVHSMATAQEIDHNCILVCWSDAAQ